MLIKKQSEEERLVVRAVKTTIQLLYDERFFDKYDNREEVVKKCLLTERRIPNLVN